METEEDKKIPGKRGRKPKPKTEESKEPKKRGRKPKPKNDDETDELPKVHKKRGRRKKCDIDSMSKISGFCASGDSIDTVGDKLHFSGQTLDEKNLEKNGGEKISFGKFNIGIQSISAPEVNTIKQNFYEKNENKNENENKNVSVSNFCNIEINSDEESDIEKNTSNIYSEDNYTKNIATSIIQKQKKKKLKKNTLIWKENSDIDLSLCLEQFRGKNNKNVKWPEKTDISCWWCCHTFHGSPKTLPYSYDKIRNRFKVMGVFCSWSCARAYAMDDTSLTVNYQISYLTEFIRQIHGMSLYIKSAPPRQSLKMFGGKMTIDEFRNINNESYVQINKANTILDPNIYFSWNFKK